MRIKITKTTVNLINVLLLATGSNNIKSVAVKPANDEPLTF